jgi:DNA replication protein DnaC
LDDEHQTVALMILTLDRAGVKVRDRHPDSVRETYAEWRREEDEQQASAGRMKADFEAETRKRAFREDLQNKLSRADVDPTGMSDDELVQAWQRRTAELEAQAIEERRRARIEWLFRQSEAPLRHTLDLDRITYGGQWVERRDLLVSQARYANGYLVALLGMRGTGKTEMATSIIRRCCREMMTCRYVKALDLFKIFRGAYTPVARGSAGVDEKDVIDTWTAYDLLVIDEVHQRGESDWENNTLVNLIDRRYDACGCTLLIANYATRGEFSQAIGPSVASRINQVGEAILCEWPSFRKPGAWKQEHGAPLRNPSGRVQ